MSLLIYLFITTQLIILPYALCVQESFQFPLHSPDGLVHPIPGQVLDDDFAEWLESTGFEWGMKGVAVAVTRRLKDENGQWAGWTSETKGYGIASRWGTPVDANTLFSIGSNSKLFTAMGIGLLTENKTLPITWETKIKDIFPEHQWKLQDGVAQNQANLIDILTHRIGLPRHDLSYSRTDSLATVISKLRHLKPSAEFRDIHQYNNQMYMLAAHIIEHVTGSPFTQFITENIISPLGLNTTTYNVVEAELSGQLADGFVSQGKDENIGEGKRKLILKPVPFWTSKSDFETIAGAGGVISTANDLVILLQMLLLNGRHPVTNATIIQESVISRTIDGVTFSSGISSKSPELSPTVYGTGQMVYSYQGHNLIEHNGVTVGHYSLITRAPDDGVGIAILVNADPNGRFVDLIKFRLLEKALRLKEINWSARYSAAEKNRVEAIDGPSPLSETYARNLSSVPFIDLAGVYFNPAYGTIRLCDFQSHLSFPEASPPGCKKTVEDIAVILHGPPPALVVEWPKFKSTHALLYHQNEGRFDISSILIFPPPFPNTPKSDNGSHPFAVESSRASGNFIFMKKIGMGPQRIEGLAITGAWGPGRGVKTLSGKDKESAEVWFDRVI